MATFTFLLFNTLWDGEEASLKAISKLYNEPLVTDINQITDLYHVTKSVTAALNDANSAISKTLAVVRMSDIETLTPTISTNTWVELLNKHLKGAYVVNSSTQVFLSDRGLLVTIGELFKNYTNEQLLRHISLLFNVLYADVATDDAYRFVNMTNESEILENLSCHFGVDERYHLLISAEHAESVFLPEERRVVTTLLEHVIQNATLMLTRDATWMDHDARQEIRIKIPNIKVRYLSLSSRRWGVKNDLGTF